VVRSISELHF